MLPSSLVCILILNDCECQVDTNSIFRYLSNEYLPHLFNLLVLWVLGILTLVLYPWEKDFPEWDLSRIRKLYNHKNGRYLEYLHKSLFICFKAHTLAGKMHFKNDSEVLRLVVDGTIFFIFHMARTSLHHFSVFFGCDVLVVLVF